jgi:hypothetical protein
MSMLEEMTAVAFFHPCKGPDIPGLPRNHSGIVTRVCLNRQETGHCRSVIFGSSIFDARKLSAEASNPTATAFISQKNPKCLQAFRFI